MKKTLALLLAVLLLFAAGCGSKPVEPQQTTSPTLSQEVQNAAGGYTFPTLEDDEVSQREDRDERPDIELVDLGEISKSKKIEDDDLKYVMIYNPYIYDDGRLSNGTLSTGDLDKQIVIDIDRADGLEEEPEMIPVGQDQINTQPFSGTMEDDRANAMSREFKKGDTEEFYAFEDSGNLGFPRDKKEFTCAYAGKYCNIWVYDDAISDADAKTCAKEFDENIYEQVVEKFGKPRFDGKVNLLYYPMPRNIGGCFANYDLLTEREVKYYDLEDIGCNTNVNLVHMSSRYGVEHPSSLSTMAHEFQHLICFTEAFGTADLTQCSTWLNEAMSGYVEELIYPGVQYKAGRMTSYMDSDLIRYGQSLYNFETTGLDIGVYGSVYLYAMYLEQLAGEDVFADVHKYWRTSYSDTLDEPEALVNAVPKKVYKAVDESVTYPEDIVEKNFNCEDEVWMSKLTLQFYLDILDEDDSDPADFRNVRPRALLYDQYDSAKIEGGGRVIIELEDDTFEIPKKAGKGLIYVALDEDFNVLSISYN